jgi:DNA-binding HxlR family transcriptional regulator
MRRTSFADMACSIARTLDVAGEWWSPLILRDVHLGITRFDELRRDLGISRKVLAERLERLVEQGALERRAYSEHPPRYDYLLTQKGRELVDILLAMVAWGDRWTAGKHGPPLLLRHGACGELTHAEIRCACCGEALHADDVTVEAGPGGSAGPGTRVVAERLASQTKAGSRAAGEAASSVQHVSDKAE